MKEILDLLDRRLEPGETGHPDTLVVFFHESPTSPNWALTAVVRMKGWNALSLEQQTITYMEPLADFLEGVKIEANAGKYGFINFNEAVDITSGTLDSEVAVALRSAQIQTQKFLQVDFLPDGRIQTSESPLSFVAVQ